VLASGPLHFLGRISYSYYLLHTVTGFALVYELTPRIGRPAAMLIATAVTLLLAWASYRWVEGSLSRRFRGALTRVAGPPPSRPDATRRVRA
jgi:peptidoglycan/LPS O-acetylase OafA/YrhL